VKEDQRALRVGAGGTQEMGHCHRESSNLMGTTLVVPATTLSR
jgi:hypothetical protein